MKRANIPMFSGRATEMASQEIAAIGVVGAGLMGAEIALVFALGGHSVLLADRDAATIDA
ncbi:3-hydroxyacyl-CoA dehydrogenase NAD-binding domain-containing protein, partial [Acinetobacter baumannii]